MSIDMEAMVSSTSAAKLDASKSTQNYIIQGDVGTLPSFLGAQTSEIPRTIGLMTHVFNDAASVNPKEFANLGITPLYTPGKKNWANLSATLHPLGTINHQKISMDFQITPPPITNRVINAGSDSYLLYNYPSPIDNTRINGLIGPIGNSISQVSNIRNPEEERFSMMELGSLSSQTNMNTINMSESEMTNSHGQSPLLISSYPRTSTNSTPDLRDERELTEEEKRQRRKQGNTESQARTRKHNALVKEMYKRNDKLVNKLKNEIFFPKDGQINKDHIREFFSRYVNFPEKERPKRIKGNPK